MNTSRRINQHQLSGIGSVTLRMLLLACVLLSQWRVPLPWLHQHDEPDASHAIPAQQQHCAIWHEDAVPEDEGWHFHFATLDEILRGAGCPIPAPDESQSQHPLVVEHDVITQQAFSEPDSGSEISHQLLDSQTAVLSVLTTDGQYRIGACIRTSTSNASLLPDDTLHRVVLNPGRLPLVTGCRPVR